MPSMRLRVGLSGPSKVLGYLSSMPSQSKGEQAQGGGRERRMISLKDKILFYLHIYDDVTVLDLETGKTDAQLSRLKKVQK